MINNNLCGVYNIGTELKTMYQLVSLTRDVSPILSPDLSPKNTSMNINKLKNIK